MKYDIPIKVIVNTIRKYRVRDLEKLRLELEISNAQLASLLHISVMTYYRMKKRPDDLLEPALACLIDHVRAHCLARYTDAA